MKRIGLILSVVWLSVVDVMAAPWAPDVGDGTYTNPILYADYSDPDLVRVGEDFYMVASSFNVMPGIPILHSKDLVNWALIGHVYDRLPFEKFDRPVHGHGSWAPAIRFRNGLFYVYFCTPHTGLFVATAKDPAGPWDLEQMATVELWEDPAPFWDDDGKAYLVRSKVRADNLYLHKMSPDGKRLLDDGVLIYRNLEEQPVIEGPKMMKKDGWYYILAPAGGVPTGWQAALRAKNLYGPYESKIVLHQGDTDINGPHQGGLVALDSGEWWFTHFQDRGVYGRIVHLQPVRWEAGWPLMGQDRNGDGIGEPVTQWKKPDVGRVWPMVNPQTSDEFSATALGLQWQWHANPRQEWYSLDAAGGSLQLNAVSNPTQWGNFRFVPNLLLQKFAAPAFVATTKITFYPKSVHDKSGLTVMGQTWGYMALYSTKEGVKLGVFDGKYEQYDDATIEVAAVVVEPSAAGAYTYYLRVSVEEGGDYQFAYSQDGEHFSTLGGPMQASKGVWIGAKVGLFSLNPSLIPSAGFAEFDWFRVH